MLIYNHAIFIFLELIVEWEIKNTPNFMKWGKLEFSVIQVANNFQQNQDDLIFLV